MAFLMAGVATINSTTAFLPPLFTGISLWEITAVTTFASWARICDCCAAGKTSIILSMVWNGFGSGKYVLNRIFNSNYMFGIIGIDFLDHTRNGSAFAAACRSGQQ